MWSGVSPFCQLRNSIPEKWEGRKKHQEDQMLCFKRVIVTYVVKIRDDGGREDDLLERSKSFLGKEWREFCLMTHEMRAIIFMIMKTEGNYLLHPTRYTMGLNGETAYNKTVTHVGRRILLFPNPQVGARGYFFFFFFFFFSWTPWCNMSEFQSFLRIREKSDWRIREESSSSSSSFWEREEVSSSCRLLNLSSLPDFLRLKFF